MWESLAIWLCFPNCRCSSPFQVRWWWRGKCFRTDVWIYTHPMEENDSHYVAQPCSLQAPLAMPGPVPCFAPASAHLSWSSHWWGAKVGWSWSCRHWKESSKDAGSTSIRSYIRQSIDIWWSSGTYKWRTLKHQLLMWGNHYPKVVQSFIHHFLSRACFVCLQGGAKSPDPWTSRWTVVKQTELDKSVGLTKVGWMFPRWVQRGASNFLWFLRTWDKHRVVFPEVIWRLHHSLAEQAFLEHTWGASSDERLLAFWFAGFEWLVHKWYTTFLFKSLNPKQLFRFYAINDLKEPEISSAGAELLGLRSGSSAPCFKKRADHFGFKLPGFDFTQDFNKIYQDHTGRSLKPRTFM